MTTEKQKRNVKTESPELIAAQVKLSATNLKALEATFKGIQDLYEDARAKHARLVAKEKALSGNNAETKLVSLFADQGVDIKKTVKRGKTGFAVPSQKFSKVYVYIVDGKIVLMAYNGRTLEIDKQYGMNVKAVEKIIKVLI